MSDENAAESDAITGPTAVEPTHRPPRASVAIAVFAALAAVGALFPAVTVGLTLTVVGAVALAGGLAVARRRYVTLGSGLQAAGIGLAAVFGAPPAQVAIALGAAVVAWDISHHALGLGEQVGAGGVAMRAEVVRGLASTAVVAATIAVATAIYSAIGGEYPVTALGALLLAALLFLAVLRAGD